MVENSKSAEIEYYDENKINKIKLSSKKYDAIYFFFDNFVLNSINEIVAKEGFFEIDYTTSFKYERTDLKKEGLHLLDDSCPFNEDIEKKLLYYPDVNITLEQFEIDQDKKTESNSQDINWGFIRQLVKDNPTGWGIGADLELERKITSQYSGKNVDVVIMDDGCPYPSTFEYAQNADGTGYTRLVQYNWFDSAEYDYSLAATTNAPRKQEHGSHTMGTTAGNTQGWARDANIYFISYNDTNAMDLVRNWHNNKPINPKTGIKNPTIINNSWGYNASSFSTNVVSSITYRGTTYSPTSGSGENGDAVWDSTLLDNFWVTRSLTRNAAADADFEDMINDGIIVVASAGNDNSYIDVPGGLDGFDV